MAGGAVSNSTYASTAPAGGKKQNYLFPFILVTSLFFLWALIHNLSPVLIPHLKKACQLTDLQSSFIDSAVFAAYFLMALPAGAVMRKFGYKAGIIFGLLMYAAGAFLFIPAANSGQYLAFLAALFVIASGLTFLETAANPYVTILGKPETATIRLNLAQSFNGVGAIVGPLLGLKFILSGTEHSKEELAAMTQDQLQAYLHSEAATVKTPYLIIGLVVLLISILFMVTKMPEVQEVEDEQADNTGRKGSIFRHKHLIAAVVAQFCYIGAQVGVNAFFIRFAKFSAGIPEKEAAFLLGSVAGLGFMIGRFFGTFLMSKVKPQVLLTIYGLINVILILLAMTTKGNIAIGAVLAVPFFMSIMFPTIFSLGLRGLGGDTKFGSSLLVMSIVGGAICPPLMGYISDISNIQMAYVVPLICFAVVVWFGTKGYKLDQLPR
ncbi:MFS transporter, FHS family, L-fucose permease [Chitinophaga jiangningensis]|uniref:MFS transporter, FHS family, L-fucose permease n=1 Tax=Chitinophaga jiangningensis TaxID=1419482 RepID=A0A1M6V4L0_9BACT|nr:L-fucose:H+ symporter permease [Chitinophaga jiangningensis]SHK76315.1 MFS transporter, FHS family, L-fucose permease [Chitinophaga jiangningensis]